MGMEKNKKKTYGPRNDLNLKVLIGLSRTTQSIHRRSSAIFRESGLTLSQFSVLEALYHKGPLTISGIIETILSTGGNITVVVSNLEKLGLAERSINPDDKRSSLITITPRGEGLIDEIFPRHLADLEGQLDPLSLEERKNLSDLLKKLSGRQR